MNTRTTDKDTALVVIKEPMLFDVILSRGLDGKPYTNVPRSVIWHSPDGFEWGYDGSGPADLALNILNAFLPPGSDGHKPQMCFKGKCSRIAAVLHQDFKRDFIATTPMMGGTIVAAKIMAWVMPAIKNIKRLEARHEKT